MAKGFEMHGFEDIDRVLAALPGKLGPQVLTRTLRKAAKPLTDEAKRLVPKDSGELAKSIGVIAAKDFGDYTGVYVGPRRGFYAGHHAHLVEYGTVMRKLDKPRVVKIGGKTVTITHTGTMPAKPFMRPAYDSKIGEVQEEVKKELYNILESGFKGVFK